MNQQMQSECEAAQGGGCVGVFGEGQEAVRKSVLFTIDFGDVKNFKSQIIDTPG